MSFNHTGGGGGEGGGGYCLDESRASFQPMGKRGKQRLRLHTYSERDGWHYYMISSCLQVSVHQRGSSAISSPPVFM
jgi:hypothetical protein